MKPFGFLLFFAASLMLPAAEITVKPFKPWKTGAEKEYIIDFNGSKTYPQLRLIPTGIKAGNFYRLSFDLKDSSENTPVLFWGEETVNGKKHTLRLTLAADREYSSRTIYFKALSTDLKLRFYLNPGPSARIGIRNPVLTELPEAKLENVNLIPCGDFENGNDFIVVPPSSRKNLSLVPSPSFFCGEKSLKVVRDTNTKTSVQLTNLPAIPGKKLEVKFYAKSEGKEVPATVTFDFWKNGHKNHLYKSVRVTIEPEWKEFTCVFDVPADTAKYTALTEGTFSLRFLLPQSPEAAAVYLDNVELQIKGK